MLRTLSAALLPLVALGSVAAAQAPSAPATRPPTQVSSSGPKPSPDGKYLAFGSNRTGILEVFVMMADGSGVVQVSPGGPGNKFAIGWSKDGRVVFSASARDTARVFSVSREGSDVRQIAGGFGRGPVPSPDGAWLVTSVGSFRAARLTIAASDGRNPHPITDEQAAAFNPDWSPDGKQLAYSRLDSTGSISVWTIGVDGSNARQITHFSPTDGRAQIPAWSPDGHRIAFQAGSQDLSDSTRHFGHIWVIDLASGTLTKLAPHAEPYLDEVPSWFPDGKRIAFQSNRTGRMEVWVMNADGTGARQLTGPP